MPTTGAGDAPLAIAPSPVMMMPVPSNRDLRFVAVAACALAACAGSGQRSASREPPPVVQIPTFSASPPPAPSEKLPPRDDTPAPPGESDPFRYYVGRWHGLVNGRFQTEMSVTADGRFRVSVSPGSTLPPCDISGRLRVSEHAIFMDVERSTCTAEQPGTTLERNVSSKTDTEFSAESADGRMFVRYTRAGGAP